MRMKLALATSPKGWMMCEQEPSWKTAGLHLQNTHSEPLQIHNTSYILMSIDRRKQATDADIMDFDAVTGNSNDSMEHNDVRHGWQDEL